MFNSLFYSLLSFFLSFFFHHYKCHITASFCIFFFFFLGWDILVVLWLKALNCGIVVSEFELQSSYYVHFRTNTLGKGMNPLILPAMG